VPVLLLLLLLLLVPFALLVLMPLVLVGRYRAGSARRQARPWVATLTLAAVSISGVFFLVAAAVTNLWIPRAFAAAAAGLAVGCVLGILGLLLTRWEPAPGTLHYTPNRWVILTITVVVLARVLYGLWRSWAVAQAGLSGGALVTAFGVPDSLAAGALVLGYQLAYSAGLRWRIHAWQSRALRVL
jgi:hypothetical protein